MARWHSGGEFPAELPERQAAVHMGMFLAWCILHDLHDAEFFVDVGLDLLVEAVKTRQMTGAELLEPLAGALASDELSAEGNDFARAYYEAHYTRDFQAALATALPSRYHVPDTWENYARIEAVLDRRFDAWVAAGRPREISGR